MTKSVTYLAHSLTVFALLSISCLTCMGQTPFLKQHCTELTFDLNPFPFNDYLQHCPLTQINDLQKDRVYLENLLGNGDSFLYRLGQTYIQENPVSDHNLTSLTELGEFLLLSKPGITRAENQIYCNIGFFLLGSVARHLEQAIADGSVSEEQPKTMALLKRLEKSQVYVAVTQSCSQKLWKYLTSGNFAYVARRIGLGVDSHFLPYRNLTSLSSPWPLYLGLLVCCLVFAVFKRKQSALLTLSLFVVGPTLLSFFGFAERMTLYQMKPYRYLSNEEVVIERIQNANHQNQGHAVWLPLSALQTTYLASGDVSGSLASLKRESCVLLATAGGFTNHLKQPEGFTVQDGLVINAVIQPNRHGLVVYSPRWGMTALNLKGDQLQLPGGEQIDNPLYRLTAYAELMRWCRAENASVFQTQLVAFEDLLLIDPEKAVKRFRERRMLALVTDRKSGYRQHVLINIKEPHMLAPLSAEVCSLLTERGQHVDALLNLDVGLYDILDIYDGMGKPLREIQGSSACDEAANLIVYSRSSQGASYKIQVASYN